jgi:hypothetical protein
MAAYGWIVRKFIRNGEVTEEKLATGAVTASKIAAGAVGSAALATGAVASVDIDPNVIQYATVSIPSASVLTLNTVPVTLVPGEAGKVISFAGAVLLLDYGTVQYATNGTIEVIEETSGTVLSTDVANTFLFANADKASTCKPIVTDVLLTPGKGLQLFVKTGNPTAGDSVLRVKVAYRVYSTGF